MSAARVGAADIAKLLIEKGANMELKMVLFDLFYWPMHDYNIFLRTSLGSEMGILPYTWPRMWAVLRW